MTSAPSVLDAPSTAPARTTVPRPLPPRSAGGAAPDLRHWLGVHTDGLVAAGIFATTAVVANWNLLGAPDFQDDEGTYTAQAMSVLDGNLAPYTYWYDHPPGGWIQLALGIWLPRLVGVGDGTDIGAARFVITMYFAISAVLIFAIARRLLARRAFAVIAASVFVLSPLSLGLGRQVYLDNLAMPWALLAFFLATSHRRQLWLHGAAGLCFAVAVLSKLTMLVLGPALLLAMIDRRAWRGRAFSIAAFLSIGGLAVLLFPLMALLRGELVAGEGHVSLETALRYQFLEREGSGALGAVGSARVETVAGWFSADAMLIVAGVLAAVICLTTRRTRWIPIAIATCALPVLVGAGYLPAMYIIVALPFLALAIGLGADLAWRATRRWCRIHAPGARVAPTVLLSTGLIALASLIVVPNWAGRDQTLLSSHSNHDWFATLSWASENIPKGDVVLVPYSMWHDLNRQGWNDAWAMIVIEKVDLDIEFDEEHPAGWVEVDWVIEGPTVRPIVDNLSLEEAEQALDSSTVVERFGAWSIRKVNPDLRSG